MVDLIPLLKSSLVLNVVHMSDNSMSPACQSLIFNMLNLDEKLVKKKANAFDQLHMTQHTSAQMKIINHQLLLDTREEIIQSNNRGKSDSAFVLYR